MDQIPNPSPTVQIITVIVTAIITITTTISSVIIAHFQLKARIKDNTEKTETAAAYSVEAKAHAMVAAYAAEGLKRQMGGRVTDLEKVLDDTKRQLSGLLEMDSKQKLDKQAKQESKANNPGADTPTNPEKGSQS